MAIDLRGRIPVIQQAFSPRIVWLALGLIAIFIASVIAGFHYRLKRQAQLKEVRQVQSASPEASTSNRSRLEGGQGMSSPTYSGLPVTASQPASNPYGAATPWQPGTQPGTQAGMPSGYMQQTYPTGGIVPPAGAPAGLYQQIPTTASAYPVTSIAQTSYAGHSAEPRLSATESKASRLEQRRQQAIDAPTGNETRTAAAVTSPALPGEMSAMPVMPMEPSAMLQPALAPGLHPGREVMEHDPNDQSGKRLFAGSGDHNSGDYLKTMRTAPLSQWVIQRGTVIPAVLPVKVVSDLPGDLVAEVARDVYDTPTQKYVEIPAGSRLVGEYNSSVSYGQNRVQIVWTAVYFPDGSFIDLDRMPSHAADGSSGLHDQTDNHLKRLIGGVALSSLLAAGLQISQNRTSSGSVLAYPSTSQEIGSAVGSQVSQLGQQITQRNLNVQPTLRIRPGELFAVSVNKDILFTGPYQATEVR